MFLIAYPTTGLTKPMLNPDWYDRQTTNNRLTDEIIHVLPEKQKNAQQMSNSLPSQGYVIDIVAIYEKDLTNNFGSTKTTETR